MDNTKNIPTLLSFCTGYGGIERGIERAIGTLRILAHVEIESYAIANLVDKMETGQMVPAPVWTNLKTFPVERFRDRVDILTAGYPCQPFSAAGKRKGTEDPRHLWPHIARAIDVIRPGLCFFENVEGHISLGLREVLADLSGLGYRVATERGEPTWGIFSAAEVGAPHQRKRLFIMAHSKESGGGRRLRQLQEADGREWQSQECRENERDESHDASKDAMADSDSKGLEGCQLRGGGNSQGRQEQDGSTEQCGVVWPARPGQEQYEWEEPRVI